MGKVDFEDPLNYLNAVGLDPRKSSNFAKVRRTVTLTVVLTVAVLGHLELMLNNKGLETWSRASESLLVQYQAIYKIFILLTKKEQILWLVKHSSKFWELQEEDRKSNFVHKLLTWFLCIYKILLLLLSLLYVLRKIINRNALPLAIVYGETDGFSPMTDNVIFFLHSVSTFSILLVVLGCDGLFFYFVGHILTELIAIKTSFIKTKHNLIESIQHHQFVLKYIENLNKTYSSMILIQHLTCVFGICFGLFLLSKDGTPPDLAHIIKYLPYILSFTTQNFTFCFFATMIAEWTVEIADAVFYSGWNKGEAYGDKHAKIMIIRRTQKPVRLTMGRYGALSLESFAWVVKNAFSFYAFISTFGDE